MPAEKSPAARAHEAINELTGGRPADEPTAIKWKAAHAALDEAIREAEQNGYKRGCDDVTHLDQQIADENALRAERVRVLEEVKQRSHLPMRHPVLVVIDKMLSSARAEAFPEHTNTHKCDGSGGCITPAEEALQREKQKGEAAGLLAAADIAARHFGWNSNFEKEIVRRSDALLARAEGASEMVDESPQRRPPGTTADRMGHGAASPVALGRSDPSRPPSEEPEPGGGRCPICNGSGDVLADNCPGDCDNGNGCRVTCKACDGTGKEREE